MEKHHFGPKSKPFLAPSKAPVLMRRVKPWFAWSASFPATRNFRRDDAPLLCAIQRQQPDAASSLLRENSDISRAELDQGLVWAASLGQDSVCRELLAAGADPGARESPSERKTRVDGTWPAFTAQQAQHQAWHQEHTPVRGSALHMAIENGHISCVEALLDGGCKVDAVDEFGVTPLMLACMRGDLTDVVTMLVDTGQSRVTASDVRYGRTALHCAALSGDDGSISILLDAGADVDALDIDLNTPLILCAKPCPWNHETSPHTQRMVIRCMEILLEHGCFVNVSNRCGRTALHSAVETSNTQVIRLLLHYHHVIHANVILETCLVQRDPVTLELLLVKSEVADDVFLLMLLIALICTKSSSWMLNNRSEQLSHHELAQLLIKHIRDINLSSSKHFISTPRREELEAMFGSEFAKQFRDSISDDLKVMGLFGLALSYGKCGVAKMLYAAGADLTPMQFIQDTDIGKLLKGQAYLSSWLPGALRTPTSLKLKSVSACRKLGLFGSRLPEEIPPSVESCLNLRELETHAPCDAAITEAEETLLDLTYSNREDAKAACQQTLCLYSTNHA